MKKLNDCDSQLHRISLHLKIIVVWMFIFLLQGVSWNSVLASELSGENEKVDSVTDLDLGDYSTSMIVGEKQLLSVTILPQTAPSQTVMFSSDNESVATINGLGRITALTIGKANITASCGSLTRSFELNVKEKNTSTKIINVTDIELADYEKELAVDKMLNISATVLPTDATDSKLTYSSSNTGIATVTSTGVVKGISPGAVEITVSAGGYSKGISLVIKVSTASIQMNTSCLVLKRGDSFQLSGKALPILAKQDFSFKSQDKSIATVTLSGNVTANSIGNTTILVSNGDFSVAVTVIVNESIKTENTGIKSIKYNNEEDSSVIFSDLLSQSEVVLLLSKEYQVISSSMLKQLYESKKTLRIQGEGYVLEVLGKNIVNYNNQINTELNVETVKSGLKVTINSDEDLPGEILLQLEQGCYYKYLYLYNSVKEKYERINRNDLSNVKIDVAGTYLFTKQKQNGLSINLYFILGFGIVAIAVSGLYIFVKKKYWFW